MCPEMVQTKMEYCKPKICLEIRKNDEKGGGHPEWERWCDTCSRTPPQKECRHMPKLIEIGSAVTQSLPETCKNVSTTLRFCSAKCNQATSSSPSSCNLQHFASHTQRDFSSIQQSLGSSSGHAPAFQRAPQPVQLKCQFRTPQSGALRFCMLNSLSQTKLSTAWKISKRNCSCLTNLTNTAKECFKQNST